MASPRDAHLQREERASEAGYAVREMTRADVPEIARVHVQVWREAYASFVPHDYLDGLDVSRFKDFWSEQLEAPPGHTLLRAGVARAGEVVAIGSAGPARDEQAPVGWELQMINVLAEHHGSGLADLLMAELVADRPSYLWVFEANERAHAFYARYEFLPDGGREVHEPTAQAEVRLVRA